MIASDAASGLVGNFDFLTGLASGLVITFAVGFAWRPDQLARQKSPREIATHLRSLQRRWGLGPEDSTVAAESTVELGEVSR